MIAQKNVTNLFITNTDAATTALPVVAGEFGVRRIGELLCDASALVAGDRFQVVVMDQKGKIVESPIYSWDNLISKSIQNVAAAASQVSTIGYNGTDGDIVATNNGNYLVTIGFKDTLKMTGNKRLYKYAEYVAGSTAAKYNIAIGLAGSLDSNMAKDAFKRIVPKALCSFAVTAGDKFDNNCTVVKGSKYLTFGTDNEYSTNETPVVGDYVRVGTVGGGTALTSNVYRIAEVTSSTVLKLDRPIVEASGTYAAATADLECIRKANGELAATKWGLVLTGNDSDAPFEVGKYGDNLITFSVGVSADFSTTEVRLGTTPSIGIGTYKGIAQLDWELQANGREKYRIAEYPVSFTPNITSSWTLTHVRTFIFKDNSTQTLAGEANSYMTLMIANTTNSDANLDTIFTQTA